jgi:2-keto-4-pentenoate hydratase/2-oxohepta-3-ene-1,7-dioic acid hydratase in catechol pathway
MSEPQFLKNGDVVACEIEGIGRLVNPVSEVGAARRVA